MSGKEKYSLVYDLGGGTFDVSILQMGDIIEVLSSTGDTHLGGDDFDDRVVEDILQSIKEKDGLDLKDHLHAIARLKGVAENAKITLSEKALVRIEETHIPAPKGRNCTVSMELSREKFETITEDLVDRTIACVEKAIREAQLTAGQIGRVLLVGGMTRMPIIQARLEKIFGTAQMPAIDPDLSVANGAAIQGGIISGENCEQILVDVTPHTLSLKVLSHDENRMYDCSPVIPRNTQIPVTRARTFQTIVPGQEQAELEIYQGESPDPEGNTLLGSASMRLTKAERLCPILVEYSYDLNGIVHLVAEQKGYGRKTELRVDSRAPRLSDSPGLEEIGEGIEGEYLEGEDAEYPEDGFAQNDTEGIGDTGDTADTVNAINFVTQRARSLISGMEPGEEKELLSSLLARYEKALRDDDDEDDEDKDIDAIEDELLALIETMAEN